MYNDYYLLKRVKEEEGAVAYASVQDSFTYKGEVVSVPIKRFYTNVSVTCSNKNLVCEDKTYPQVGDKVLFLKGQGEDIQIDGEQMKAVKFEDLIMPIE